MIQLVKGTKDIYGVEVKAWQEIEGKMRRLCETFGIGEIRTPAFEFTELFVRGVGETIHALDAHFFQQCRCNRNNLRILRRAVRA